MSQKYQIQPHSQSVRNIADNHGKFRYAVLATAITSIAFFIVSLLYIQPIFILTIDIFKHSNSLNKLSDTFDNAGIGDSNLMPEFPNFPILNCTTKDSITYVPPNSTFALKVQSLRTLSLEARGIAIAAAVYTVRESTEDLESIDIQITFRLSSEDLIPKVSFIARETRIGVFSILVKSPFAGSLDEGPEKPCILVLVQVLMPRSPPSKDHKYLNIPPGLFINTKLVAGVIALNMTNAGINLAALRAAVGTGVIAGNNVKASTSITLINGAGGIVGTYSGFRQFSAGTVTQGALYVDLAVKDRNPALISVATKSGPVAAAITDNFRGRFLVQTENGATYVTAPNPDDIKYDDDGNTEGKKSGLKSGVGLHRATIGTGYGTAVLRFVEIPSPLLHFHAFSNLDSFGQVVDGWGKTNRYLDAKWD